jgi:hypothetical protein
MSPKDPSTTLRAVPLPDNVGEEFDAHRLLIGSASIAFPLPSSWTM